MTKQRRWTFDDDMFLATYSDMHKPSVSWSNFLGDHDLDHGPTAGYARVKRLMENGAWWVLHELLGTEAQQAAYDAFIRGERSDPYSGVSGPSKAEARKLRKKYRELTSKRNRKP